VSDTAQINSPGMVDIHSHILPGLDDGASDWADSIAMAQVAVADGIREVVCTPHWVSGSFENTRPSVLTVLHEFREKLHEHEIPLTVYPGGELRLDVELAGKINSGELLTLNDTGRYVLIELPAEFLPRNLENIFWELQSQDITPVLGHPERNCGLHRDPMLLYRLVEMGSLVQITAGSVTGRFGPEVRKFSHSLLEHGLVHVIGTDSHGAKTRTPRLTEALKQATEILGERAAERMVNETPRRIVEGNRVVPDDPVPLTQRSRLGTFFRRSFSFLGLTNPKRF
jgi:protein-tyrosine phosphatase